MTLVQDVCSSYRLPIAILPWIYVILSGFALTDLSLCRAVGAPADVDLRREVRMLPCDPMFTALSDTRSCLEWWSAVGEKYVSIGRVLPFIFALPNSNASTERYFSVMKAVHTPVRNKLALSTINNLLHIKINKTTPSYIIDNKELLLPVQDSNTALQPRASASQVILCNRTPFPAAYQFSTFIQLSWCLLVK